MKVCIIFGGSGYIGTYLAKHFIETNSFDYIYIADIKPTDLKSEKIQYKEIDVRNKINLELENIDKKNSWVFNLAAVHREPGHEPYEYYETNIKGAENVCEYVENLGIENTFFTSSIAPYGESYDQKTENSLLQPVTPYGISKALAEKIHLIWQARAYNVRRLIICRPAVIYGPGDPGNILRMIKSIKKGLFFFPGDPNIIKAYGYIYGLIDSIDYVMNVLKERVVIYNYAEWPLLSLKEMADEIRNFCGINRPVFKIPMSMLVTAAALLQLTGIRKFKDYHPVRVRKAGFPTNIKPQFLIEKHFEFRYGFVRSLEHWKSLSQHDFET